MLFGDTSINLLGAAGAGAGGGALKPVVALQEGTVVGYTTNKGVTWASETIATARWDCVAWNGTVFCSISQNSSDSATSPDGITWTKHTGVIPGANSCIGIAYGAGVFVALANSANFAFFSTDGISWTSAACTVGGVGSGPTICYNGSVFFACAPGTVTCATSANGGVSWTTRTLSSNANWQNMAWNGTVFCVVNQTNGTTSTSPDGITWTGHASALPWGASCICSDGTQFVATQFSGKGVATSPNGVTWTSRTSAFSAPLLSGALCWDGAEFMGVGNGQGATSPDGITWTAITPPSINFQCAIAQNLTFGTF